MKDGVVFDYTQFPAAEVGNGNSVPVSNLPWVEVRIFQFIFVFQHTNIYI